jgi:hypothetical protein
VLAILSLAAGWAVAVAVGRHDDSRAEEAPAEESAPDGDGGEAHPDEDEAAETVTVEPEPASGPT